MDEWSGIEFGNIDESNEEPLTNELLADLNSKFAGTNAQEMPRDCYKYKEATVDAGDVYDVLQDTEAYKQLFRVTVADKQ